MLVPVYVDKFSKFSYMVIGSLLNMLTKVKLLGISKLLDIEIVLLLHMEVRWNVNILQNEYAI